MQRYARFSVVLASLLVAPVLFAEGVLIQCSRPCNKEIAAVRKVGGTITYQGGRHGGVALQLEQIGGQWRVAGFRFDPPL